VQVLLQSIQLFRLCPPDQIRSRFFQTERSSLLVSLCIDLSHRKLATHTDIFAALMVARVFRYNITVNASFPLTGLQSSGTLRVVILPVPLLPAIPNQVCAMCVVFDDFW
jgi:hypothetical protein